MQKEKQMTKLEAITTRLQPKEITILKKYYTKGKEENSQHLFWEKLSYSLTRDYSALKTLDALGFVHLELEKNQGVLNMIVTFLLYTQQLFIGLNMKTQVNLKSGL